MSCLVEQAWIFVLTSALGNCEHLQAAAAAKSITAHSKHVLSGKATANSQNETQQKFANMSLSLLCTAGKVIFFYVCISTGQTNCLNDLPDMDGSIPGWKPGLYYGADEQCKIAFGSIATACTFADSNVVGRKFLCVLGAAGKCSGARIQEKRAWDVVIMEGLKVLFRHRLFWQRANLKRFLKCSSSLHRCLCLHKTPLRFTQYPETFCPHWVW